MNAYSDLKIKVKILEDLIHLGGFCRIEVTVLNVNKKKLIINGRLAVGYRDTLSRELFADLKEYSSGRKAEIVEVDYHRSFSNSQDYITLETGDDISTSFDLFEFYSPTKPGDYLLVIHYQADEPMAKFPQDVVRGIFSSDPVKLEVRG